MLNKPFKKNFGSIHIREYDLAQNIGQGKVWDVFINGSIAEVSARAIRGRLLKKC